ncbi:MAG: trypsin-like peptidase domain-containing protein, partial [Lachnospiraceae bacterium]|nr:trypsin-like peptidase domain-containing protein [Lachnospiraceae bacterium]
TDYAPWQQPQASFEHQENRKNRKKTHHPLLKKAAGITAAALLFGAVAGGTFAGINLISDGISSKYATEETEISKAETLPAPTEAKPENGGSNAVTAIPAVTNDVSAIVEQAMPSVVAINSVTEIQTQNWFGQTQIYEGKGSGSGIIAGESDSELLIVTNNHVVEGAKTLQVIFTDNETVEANVKGTDSENDLAVIAVPLDKIGDSTKSKIAVATLGDSDALKVGQGVIAIGNALGYGQSVTVGYVSALDREVKTDEMTTRNLLQTDAAINPGNSGGALLNMKGEVVGINSAKYSSTEVEGMGYAIPISKVQDIIDELMTKKTRVQVEEANQGYLGIQGTDIDQNAATLYGMPQGVFVYKITEDGAAASSELKEKDIITKFDGQSIRSMQELKDMLTYYAGGDTIQLTVQSLVDGKYVERQVEITLGTKPAEAPVNQ